MGMFKKKKAKSQPKRVIWTVNLEEAKEAKAPADPQASLKQELSMKSGRWCLTIEGSGSGAVLSVRDYTRSHHLDYGFPDHFTVKAQECRELIAFLERAMTAADALAPHLRAAAEGVGAKVS